MESFDRRRGHRRRRRGPRSRRFGARPRRGGDPRRGELRHRRACDAERRPGASRRRQRPAEEVRHQGQPRADLRRLDNPQARRRPVQRPRPGARIRRRMRADLPVPARQRRHLHREADRHAGRLDRAAGVRHPRMAHPGRGDRAAKKPQRLGPRSPPRRKRAPEGRADPAQARDAGDRARRTQGPRDRHHRASGRQGYRHRGQEGHRHRDRRPHRQRQFPQDVRSAAHRGVPAGRPALLVPGRRRRDRRHGDRRVAVGDRHADRRGRPRHHQDAPCRNAVGLSQPLLRDRQSRSSISARRPG